MNFAGKPINPRVKVCSDYMVQCESNKSSQSNLGRARRRPIPIGYNGRPKTASSPSTTTTPCSTLILDRPHSPSQTASGSNQPLCRSTLSGATDERTQTDRPTHGIGDRSVRRALTLYHSDSKRLTKEQAILPQIHKMTKIGTA